MQYTKKMEKAEKEIINNIYLSFCCWFLGGRNNEQLYDFKQKTEQKIIHLEKWVIPKQRAINNKDIFRK